STGGAIDVGTASVLNIRDTSIVNNTSGSGGGGIRFGTAPLFVSNSTISGNTANGTTATTGGAGVLASSTTAHNLTIEKSTITNNRTTNLLTVGGGIFLNSGVGTVTLTSTIVAGNVNGNSRDIGASAARTIDGSNNLFGAIDTAIFTLSGSTNQQGTELAPL